MYAIWDRSSGALVYVGETSGLRDRFGDLGRLPNHTFRRYAARLLKVNRALRAAALSSAMAARFEVGFLVVKFGRAELEEFLILRFRASLVNKPAKRLLRSPQYDWVVPV